MKKKTLYVISTILGLLLAVNVSLIIFLNIPSLQAKNKLELAQRYIEDLADTAKDFVLEDILGLKVNYSRTMVSGTEEIPKDQRVISEEYGDYSMVQFSESYQGTDYRYPYKNDQTKAYHVTKFQGSTGNPIEFEWIGTMELGTDINRINELQDSNYIELTDSTDEVRLFAMSETYDKDTLDSAENVRWDRVINADVKSVKDGLCEITEFDEGYHVLLDVESDTRKGYASIYVDNNKDTVTQFIYTETVEQYDEERAKTFISNLQRSDNVVTQKKDKICVEAGNLMDFIPGEYLEGNPWELSQCVVDKEKDRWVKIGTYTGNIKFFETIYPLQVEVIDTRPPVFFIDEMSGFAFEGQELNLDDNIDIITQTDYSTPLKRYYKENENTLLITKDLADEEGNIYITVCLEDAAGNVTEKTTTLKYIERNFENTWMEKVGIDVQEYWSWVYMEYSIDPTLSVEEARKLTDEFWGLDKTKKGIEIAESGIIKIQYKNEDTDNMQKFYEGLTYVPEKVLQRFKQYGWYLQAVGYKLDNSITGGEAAGDAWSDTKRIRYTTSCYQSEATIPHEFGHFVDFAKGKKSSSAEFMALYNERKSNRVIPQMDNYDEFHTYDADGIYTGYSFANEIEFFGDSFEKCMMEPEKMKATYPEIYEYIMKCIDGL